MYLNKTNAIVCMVNTANALMKMHDPKGRPSFLLSSISVQSH